MVRSSVSITIYRLEIYMHIPYRPVAILGIPHFFAIMLHKNHFNIKEKHYLNSGPDCLKLTTSLINVSLKFQTLISQIYQYFLLKNVSAKASFIFSTKISVYLVRKPRRALLSNDLRLSY